jgi:hypothetical protein
LNTSGLGDRQTSNPPSTSGIAAELELSFPRIASGSVDDAKDHHIAVNDPVVNHIRVAHERDTPDARSVVDFLCAFGKLRDPLEYTLYSPLEPRCRERIFRSNIGQNFVKLGEREL